MTETQTDLESMLADSAPAPQAEPATEQPEPQQQATGEPTHEGPPPSTTEPDDNSPTVPRKAMEDFRRKWQQSEKEKQDYAAQLADFQRRMAQPQQMLPQAEVPDPFADPEGWANHQTARTEELLYRTRVEMSTEAMRDKHQDYDDVIEVFVGAANQDRALWQKIRQHPFPAKFAYEQGKRMRMLSEIGDDPTAYEQKVIEKYLASQGQSPNGQQPASRPTAPLPKSLASAPSAVSRDPKGRYAPTSGPPSLSQLLGEG